MASFHRLIKLGIFIVNQAATACKQPKLSTMLNRFICWCAARNVIKLS